MSIKLKSLYRKARRIIQNQNGQGLVEYALILVLIAIVVMVAVRGLGTSTNTVYSKVNSSMVQP